MEYDNIRFGSFDVGYYFKISNLIFKIFNIKLLFHFKMNFASVTNDGMKDGNCQMSGGFGEMINDYINTKHTFNMS